MMTALTRAPWLLGILLLAACAGKSAQSLKGADFYYDKGMKDFEHRRYLEAVESFQRVLSNFPGYAYVAEAQYQLAESYYHLDEFVNAVFEYERLVDTYPSNSLRVQAQIKIGDSYFEQSRRAELDQTETYQALAAYRRFIEDNRGSPLVADAEARIAEGRERLAKKDFLACRLYHRQGHLQAALMSYEQMIRSYPDTPYYWHGLAHLGRVQSQLGDTEEARASWAEVLAGDCDDDGLLDDVKGWVAELNAE